MPPSHNCHWKKHVSLWDALHFLIFPQRVIIQRVLPQLCLEFSNHQMIPFVLPNVLLIAEDCTAQEFCDLILPELKPVFKIQDPIQVSCFPMSSLFTFSYYTCINTCRLPSHPWKKNGNWSCDKEKVFLAKLQSIPTSMKSVSVSWFSHCKSMIKTPMSNTLKVSWVISEYRWVVLAEVMLWNSWTILSGSWHSLQESLTTLTGSLIVNELLPHERMGDRNVVDWSPHDTSWHNLLLQKVDLTNDTAWKNGRGCRWVVTTRHELLTQFIPSRRVCLGCNTGSCICIHSWWVSHCICVFAGGDHLSSEDGHTAG